MQDYKEIRQGFLAGESWRHITKALGISRNTVTKYCDGSAVPWERKTSERESPVISDDVTVFIRACLQEDEGPGFRKQKHTAKRIYDRLVAERGFTEGESTIRRKVREIRAELPQAFIPLVFNPSEAIQVDREEADIYNRGRKERIHLFCARLCFSCRPVVLAYHREDEESFCDAIVRTFNIIGGVTNRVIFDNGRVAVKKGFGSHATMQNSYASLSAHYGFEAIFCNPAEGHEKGLVEGLVDWARRNICVPVPRIDGIDELNQLLLDRCALYESRKASVGVLYSEEKEHLNPLPVHPFETACCVKARGSAFSTVRYKSNAYSVPERYAGYHVNVKGYPESIEIYYKGELLFSHERINGRDHAFYHLDDYLPLLERRPRVLFDAAPVRQNVPNEVLQMLKENATPKAEITSILKHYADGSHTIKGPVTVPAIDLHRYDALIIGKEG